MTSQTLFLLVFIFSKTLPASFQIQGHLDKVHDSMREQTDLISKVKVSEERCRGSWNPFPPPYKAPRGTLLITKRNRISDRKQPCRTLFWTSNASENLPRCSTWYFASLYNALIIAISFSEMFFLRRGFYISIQNHSRRTALCECGDDSFYYLCNFRKDANTTSS